MHNPSVPDAEWTVGAADAGVRLDKFLASPARLASRGRATDALVRGKVFLNGIEADPGDAARRLSAGDAVRVWMDRPGTSRRRPGPGRLGPIGVVYEDAALIVLDKPAGLLTVPLPAREAAPSVYDYIEDRLRSHGKRRPLVVHRIDRDTSGLVVFAKQAAAQARLKDQFRQRQPDRVYLAVVYGRPDPPRGTWHDRLLWDREALLQRPLRANDPRGTEAIAEYRLVEAFEGASLIEVRLVTGKQNQIRVQAARRGHVLVGEQRYLGGAEVERPIEFPRQALHAARLSFDHPDDGRRLAFEAPLPADLSELVGRLRGPDKAPRPMQKAEGTKAESGRRQNVDGRIKG